MTVLTTVAPRSLAAEASATADPIDTLVKAWLVGYKSRHTRDVYNYGVRSWRTFADAHAIAPLAPLRPHLELWLRSMEAAGSAKRTISSRFGALSSFFTYLVAEDVLAKHPMRGVHRPKIDRISPSNWLTMGQLYDVIDAAETMPAAKKATLMLLTFNGLRIGELCSLDISSLGTDGYHPVITFTRKGDKLARATLSRPTEVAVRDAIGDRRTGPMLLNEAGNRMRRENVQRIIDQALKHVRGHHDRITPHSLRHSWVSACRDTGVPIEQIQHDGGWTDMRMVHYYGHGLDRPERAGTHALTAAIYGKA